ncbi:MAG: TRAP transporter small permease [Smithellaceae bacterium]|nr:TRAP transporter small permease [Smithellaceae bacterium]NLX50586.1 TRAP transporter small permease [Deltaproteobacteria bacterium]
MTHDDRRGPKQGPLRKINRLAGYAVNTLEVTVLVFCVAALAALLIANVVARTFFQSIYFAEELAMFLVILLTFTGLSYGVRRARHIRMGAFLDHMPPQMEKIFIFIISGVSAAVMAVMAWASWDYLQSAMAMGHTTPALRLPRWIFYIILPTGFTLAAIQYLRTIVKNIVEPDPWLSPDQKSEYEENATGGMS